MRALTGPRRAVGFALFRTALLAIAIVLVPAGALAAAPDTRAAPSTASAPSRPRTMDDCDARVRAHPGDRMAYVCYAIVTRATRQGEEAARRLRAILAREPGNPSAKLALGLVLIDSGEPRPAMPLLRESADGYDAAGDPFGVVHARMSLARLLEIEGSPGPAEDELDAAERAAVRTGDPVQRLRVLYGRAWHAQRLSDYGRAWTLFKEVEAGSIPDGPPDLQAGVLNGLGAVAWPLERYAEGLDYYRRAADYCRSLGDVFGEASNLFNIAFQYASHMERGELDPSELDVLIRRALDAAVRTGNAPAEGAVHLLLAQIPSVPRDERISQAEKALAIFRRTNDSGNTASSLRVHALRLVEKDGALADTALHEVDDAISIARSHGDAWNLAEGWMARADIGWAADRGAVARGAADEAIETIERIREMQPDAEVRADSFSPYGTFYRRYVGRLLDGDGGPEGCEQAFRVSERMRARVLLEALDDARVPGPERSRHPAETRRAEVLTEVARVQRTLLDPRLAVRERDAALARLAALEREEAALREAIAREDPSFRDLHRPEIPSLAEIQSTLAENEALLSFTLSTRQVDARKWRDNGGSWVMAITRRSARAVALPERDMLEREIGVYLGLFERRDGLEAAGSARLYADLLGEVLRGLPTAVDTLVIVPDQELHRLPFGALREDPAGDPVAVRFEIAVVPSATLWARWRATPALPSPVPALALADPPIARDERDTGGRAGSEPKTSVRNGGDRVEDGNSAGDGYRQARPWVDGLELRPLPGARAEARFLIDRLGGESLLREGADASERFLETADLSRYALLHFAVHAVADDDRPDRSALVLAPGAPDEDGLVQIREIVGLDLRGRVIVLSACSSAGGRIVSGEGVVGLARGFFQAGARAVVASLWPLRDEEAQVLVEDLTSRLAEGRSVGDALAQAARDRIRHGDPPAAWAGVVVLGDGAHVPFPGGRPSSPGGSLRRIAPGLRGSWSGPAFVLVLAAIIAAMAMALSRAARRV